MSVTDDTLEQLLAMRIRLDKTVDATTRTLLQMWSTAWEELAHEWAAALDDLLLDAETGWPSRTKVWRAQRVQRAMAVTRDELANLARRSGATITGDLPGLLTDAEEWVQALADTQVPELTDWARVDDRAMRAIVERTTGQVEALTMKLPAEQQQVMKSVLIRGVAVGDNPREAARIMLQRLGGAFDGGRARAERIARTEMLDAHRNAHLAARKANADVLDGWVWMCSLSPRTCPACLAMHGSRHKVDEFGPEGHQNCRCVALPVTRSWRDLGFDIDEPADTIPDARAWFEQQPEQVQRHIMGAERLNRLRSGDLEWDQMAARRQTDGWRDSYVVRPLAA